MDPSARPKVQEDVASDTLYFPPPGFATYEEPSFFQWPFLLRRNPLVTFPASSYRRPHMTWNIPSAEMHFLFDPELIEEVLIHQFDAFPKAGLQNRFLKPLLGNSLITTEGAQWRRQRKIAAPIFRPRSLDLFSPGMNVAVDELLESWPVGAPADVVPLCQRLALNVLQHTLFSDARNIDSDAMLASATRVLKGLGQLSVVDLLNLPFMLRPQRWSSMRHAEKIRTMVNQLIKSREHTGDAGTDLLGRFISAEDPETGERMPPETVVDNIMTLFGAGFETTAGVLAWTLHILAQSPSLQDALAAEAKASPDHDGDPIKTHPLALRVIKETLRLFPSVPVVIRMAARDAVLGDLAIKRGSLVYVCIFVSHRNETTWPDPSRFDPDRFLPENEEARHRTAFLPFGAGPRICIGSRFALMEAVIALAGLTRMFRFSEAPGNSPTPRQYITLRAEGGINLIALARN